ncbi:Transposase IS4 [Popillia japonica]|uniref:Transposase IS4 n=1 Tax=Popillia japonica TaxID=7064 RepID=A0AAW1JBA8_POPJA
MYKVRPLMNLLNRNFQEWGVFHKDLSIDEAMIKYFGHHPPKQFIRGKPVRFGFKDWMLCSSTGYCYKFDTYCGKDQSSDVGKQPLGPQVVLSLLQVVEVPSDHPVYFDNYFTSYELLTKVRQRGYKATGTVREQRLKKCPLQTQKEMAKLERSSYDYQFDQKHEILAVRWKDNSICTMATNHDTIEPMAKVKRWYEILAVRWKDNSICTMATNHDTIEPMAKVKRWSKIQKGKIDMNQPHLFQSYNKGMGGVDLLDQSVSTYRIAIRSKKWWWPLFTHMINLAMTNAWRLHVMFCEEKMDQLSFTRYVTRHYLRLSNRAQASRNKPSVPPSIAADSLGHFPKKLEKQLRCVMCHARIRWCCKKCEVTLCIERECFENFHIR